MSDEYTLLRAIFVVQMTSDHTTASFGLGMRTFREGRVYRMLPEQGEESIQAGVAEQIDWGQFPQAIRPEFDRVRIVPKVSRWFTANGVDTHHLTAGQEAIVPSNLAEYLHHAGYAELAA